MKQNSTIQTAASPSAIEPVRDGGWRISRGYVERQIDNAAFAVTRSSGHHVIRDRSVGEAVGGTGTHRARPMGVDPVGKVAAVRSAVKLLACSRRQ
jgi:hypothetical protein